MAILLVSTTGASLPTSAIGSIVMYAGQVVERSDLATIPESPLASLYAGIAGVEPAPRGRFRAAPHDPGQRARARSLAGGLPIPSALRLRDVRVQPRAGRP